MKIYVKELIEITSDFYKMRKNSKSEKALFIIIPALIGLCFIICSSFLGSVRDANIFNFTEDLLGQLITLLTLFISFTIAYLSILVTSSSDNVIELKNTLSSKYSLNGKEMCTLYQVLISDITYTLVVEIIFLLLVFFEKFLVYIVIDKWLKIIIAFNIIYLVHILLLTGLIVKNIYYSFWKSK